MALQRSTCLARAAQGVFGAVQQPLLFHTSTSPILRASSQFLRQKKYQNNFSTSIQRHAEELELSRAAPEIDFNNFSIRPARIVPASPAYFSGSPKFIDHQIKLERLLEKYAQLPTLQAGEAPRMAWFKLAQFRDLLGEPIPAKKYKNFQKVLQRLNRIQPELLPEEVRETLYSYVRPGNPYANKPAPKEVDEFGRARGKGKRKESSAVVYLVEGEGEVLVNDKNIVDAFPRVHDRESALWALRCTQRLDKYNVWAKVSGGGVTGQAEAITLAVARALMVHEPALKPVLRQGMFSTLLFLVVTLLTHLLSRCHHSRCSSCGEEEAWPCQGKKDAYLGQAMKVLRGPCQYYYIFSYCVLYQQSMVIMMFNQSFTSLIS